MTRPTEQTAARLEATYHNAGRLPEGDLYIFTCWNAEKTGCGCHSVYGHELQANIGALQRLGYAVINNDARVRS